MESLSPNAIVLLVIFGLTLAGLVIALFRDRTTYAGYEGLTPEALRISKSLKGELFRDGADLVMSGNYCGRPVCVRFSQSENTPGLNIRMSTSTNFTLWIATKRVRSDAGRMLLSTGEPTFDNHFACTSNHPQDAGLFLKDQTVRTALHHLMRSQDTFFTVSPACMEVSELAMPKAGTAFNDVLEPIAEMHRLARVAAMQEDGSDLLRAPLLGSALLVRVIIAIGIITAIVVIVGATRQSNVSAVIPSSSTPSSSERGILPVDLPLVPQAGRYRAATEADLDPSCLNWLRNSGEVRAGRVPGDYSGNPGALDVAYLLVGNDGKRRVVLLAGRSTKLDSEYTQVGLIARIPRGHVGSVVWTGPKPLGDADGDALLIVRDPDDLSSAVVLYLSSGRVVSGVPTDFQKIRLH